MKCSPKVADKKYIECWVSTDLSTRKIQANVKQWNQGKPLPSWFLSLPTELRVQIHRYLFRCAYPIRFTRDDIDDIDNIDDGLRIHPSDDVAVPFLRTCKLIYREGSEVFYGENEFRFCNAYEETYGVFEVLWRLNKNAFDLLKELTISIPFSHTYIEVYRRGKFGLTYFLHDQKVVTSANSRVDFWANRLIKDLLDAVAGAPLLRKLNLVIPEWIPHTSARSRFPKAWLGDDYYIAYAYLHGPDV